MNFSKDRNFHRQRKLGSKIHQSEWRKPDLFRCRRAFLRIRGLVVGLHDGEIISGKEEGGDTVFHVLLPKTLGGNPWRLTCRSFVSGAKGR